MDCNPQGSSLHGDSPGKNNEVVCHVLLQAIFLTHGSNPGFPHCRWIIYQLSHKGSARILEWVALSLLQGIFPTQELNQSLLHCRWILYQLSYQGSQGLSRDQMLNHEPLSYHMTTNHKVGHAQQCSVVTWK